MYKKALIPLLVLLSPAAFAQTLMNVDFESDTPGSLPAESSSATRYTTDGNIVQVQDTSYTPANPFGGNALYLYAPATSSKAPGIWFQTDDTTLVSQGSFSFDVQVNSTFLDLRLGSNVGSSSEGRINGQGAIRLLIGQGNGDSNFSVYQNGDDGIVTDQGFTYGEQLSITVNWNFSGENAGYSVSVNGTPLTVAGSQTVFDFYEPDGLVGINTTFFRLGTGTNTDSTYQIWADNLVLTSVPESSSTGLILGVVSLLTLLAYRRRSLK